MRKYVHKREEDEEIGERGKGHKRDKNELISVMQMYQFLVRNGNIMFYAHVAINYRFLMFKEILSIGC